MSNDSLKKAFELIDRNYEKADFDGKKDEQLIALAESKLGLQFPQTYRAYLAKYGCGDIAGREFFGLISSDFENSGIPDAIWLTLKERSSSGLPPSLVVVYAIGDGSYCAIDTLSHNEQGENPIVIWVPGYSNSGVKLEKIANDFGEFLFNTINKAIQS